MPKEGDDTPQRPVDLRRKRRQPPTQLIASPAYDLLLSLFMVFGSRDLSDYEIDPAWRDQARAQCPPALLATLAYFFGDEDDNQWCASRLCAILWQAPAPLDINATLNWLTELPVENIVTVLLERDGLGDDWLDVAQPLIRTQVANQGRKVEAQTRAINTFAKRFPQGERAEVIRLLSAPEAERTRLVQAVRDWYTLVFSREEARLLAAITRETASLAKRQAEGAAAEELFTSVIQGIEFDLPAATERLILAPSVMITPTVFHFRMGDTITYCFPIPDMPRNAHDSLTMQRRETVRLFDALADDTRLRILRHLAERTMYLTELAEHLKLTKATTRHHMVRLRAAGLVTLHMRDHLSYYTLRRETLDQPTPMLLHFLGLS